MSLHTTLRRFYAPEHLIKKERFLEKPPDSVSVYRKLLEVAWPATLESVLLGLVSFVDGLMVSTVGTAAIAAVGVTNQPRLLFFAVFFAMNIGITAIVSRRKGQGDRDGANECLAQAVAIALILGVVLCTVAIIVAEPLIAFAGADEDIFDDAVAYFRIIMAGMLFTSVGMAINAAQRGIGNTKISMITNIAANLTNCVFNYFLINGIWFFPALGVRGAAYATLLGNVVSFVMSLYSVTAAKGYLHIRLRHCFHLRRGMLALLARIGGSAGVEQVFMRIGFFAYSKMVAELSTADLSTHIICMNVINLSFTVGDGLGVAASALVGQNLGAKRPDLAEVYGKAAQRFGFLLSALLVLAFSFGGSFLVSLFTTAYDEAVAYIMEKGVVIMYLIALTSPAQISQVIFSGCLRGAGDTVFVAVSSLVSIALVRPLLTYLFCYPLGFAVIGAWISLVVDQYLRLLFCGARFAGGKWTKIEV